MPIALPNNSLEPVCELPQSTAAAARANAPGRLPTSQPVECTHSSRPTLPPEESMSTGWHSSFITTRPKITKPTCIAPAERLALVKAVSSSR